LGLEPLDAEAEADEKPAIRMLTAQTLANRAGGKAVKILKAERTKNILGNREWAFRARYGVQTSTPDRL